MNERKFLRNNIAMELKKPEGRKLKRTLRKANRKPSYFNCVAMMMGGL